MVAATALVIALASALGQSSPFEVIVLGDGNADVQPLDIKKGEGELQANPHIKSFKGDEKAYRNEVQRIKAIRNTEIPIRDASVKEAIELIANAADMQYITPSDEEFEKMKVSLRKSGSPWELFGILSDAFGVGMEYRHGVWYFYPINIYQMVTRKYQIRYNTHEEINVSPPSLNSTISSSGAANDSGGGGSNSQSVDEVFEVADKEKQMLIEKVKEVIQTPTTGLNLVDAETWSVDNPQSAQIGQIGFTPKHHKNDSEAKGSVAFASDNRTMLITATRQQHMRIERLLEMFDQPQQTIKIQATLVESQRNPQTAFGVDWSGVSGSSLALESFESEVDFDDGLTSPNITLPQTAVLTQSQLEAQIDFLTQETSSRVLQDPLVTTLNNEPVSLRVVQQEPVRAVSETEQTATTSSDQSGVSFLPIGTTMYIYPQITEGEFSEDSIRLIVVLNVSSIVGEKIIGDEEFPIVAERSYENTVVVPSGKTLAITGLTERRETRSTSSVPILGSLPLVGSAFSSDSVTEDTKHLVAYITPDIMYKNSSGITSRGTRDYRTPEEAKRETKENLHEQSTEPFRKLDKGIKNWDNPDLKNKKEEDDKNNRRGPRNRRYGRR